MILNFGHTLGHAIESYYNYEKYTHGKRSSDRYVHDYRKNRQIKKYWTS